MTENVTHGSERGWRKRGLTATAPAPYFTHRYWQSLRAAAAGTVDRRPALRRATRPARGPEPGRSVQSGLPVRNVARRHLERRPGATRSTTEDQCDHQSSLSMLGRSIIRLSRGSRGALTLSLHGQSDPAHGMKTTMPRGRKRRWYPSGPARFIVVASRHRRPSCHHLAFDSSPRLGGRQSRRLGQVENKSIVAGGRRTGIARTAPRQKPSTSDAQVLVPTDEQGSRILSPATVGGVHAAGRAPAGLGSRCRPRPPRKIVAQSPEGVGDRPGCS